MNKPFVSVASEDALPVTDAEKASVEQAEKDHKALLDFAQETLKGEVSKVRISKILQSGAVCLTAEGPVSLEMEKYFRKMRPGLPHECPAGVGAQSRTPPPSRLCARPMRRTRRRRRPMWRCSITRPSSSRTSPCPTRPGMPSWCAV